MAYFILGLIIGFGMGNGYSNTKLIKERLKDNKTMKLMLDAAGSVSHHAGQVVGKAYLDAQKQL